MLGLPGPGDLAAAFEPAVGALRYFAAGTAGHDRRRAALPPSVPPAFRSVVPEFTADARKEGSWNRFAAAYNG